MENPDPPPRRGRLPQEDRASREEELLNVTRAAVVDLGYQVLTMSEIARRAHASKETLYSWFGSKAGLVTALIEHDADASASRLSEALADPATDLGAVQNTLTAYAASLLNLLTGPSSVALNRAAASCPELATSLLKSGRHRIGPIVTTYLGLLHDAGTISAPDAAQSFELLYGLIVRDTQIRVLLGEPAPTTDAIQRRAVVAVQQFLQLTHLHGSHTGYMTSLDST